MQDNFLPNKRHIEPSETPDFAALMDRITHCSTFEGVEKILERELQYYKESHVKDLYILKLAHYLKPYQHLGFPVVNVLEWTREKTRLIEERVKNVKLFKDVLTPTELTRLKNNISENKNSGDENLKLFLPLLELQLEIHNKNSNNDKKKPKPTMNVIALIYAYEEWELNKNNHIKIATEYGHTSGHKLYMLFNKVNSTTQRTGEMPDPSWKKYENRIKNIEEAIKYLSEKAKEKALSEVKTLKANAKKYEK